MTEKDRRNILENIDRFLRLKALKGGHTFSFNVNVSDGSLTNIYIKENYTSKELKKLDNSPKRS